MATWTQDSLYKYSCVNSFVHIFGTEVWDFIIVKFICLGLVQEYYVFNHIQIHLWVY